MKNNKYSPILFVLLLVSFRICIVTLSQKVLILKGKEGRRKERR
jgi:hypothetical protein